MRIRSKSLQIVLIAFVIQVIAGISASFLHNRPTYMSDTVTYVVGGRSLAAENGYMRDGHPITTWPPGYSFLLSGLVRVGLDSFIAFKTLNIIFATIAIGLLLVLFCQFLSIWESAALALAVGSFFPWIYYTHTILADIPFAAIVTAFALCSTLHVSQTSSDFRFQVSGFSFSHRLSKLYAHRYLIAASLLCAIAPLIRSAGLALIPALAVLPFSQYFAPQKSGQFQLSAFRFQPLLNSFVILLPTALTLSLWFLRNYHLTGSVLGYSVGVTPEYMLSLQKIGINDPGLIDRIWVNVRGYTHIFIIPDQTGIARISHLNVAITLGCLVLWIVMFVGFVRTLSKNKGRAICIIFASYMGMLLLNSWYDIRYILPVLGLCFLFLYDGITLSINAFVVCVFSAFRGSLSAPRRPPSTVHRLLTTLPRVAFLLLFVVGNLAFSLASSQAKTLRAPDYQGELQRIYTACQYLKSAEKQGSVMTAGGSGFIPVWAGRPIVSLLSFVRDGELTLQGVPNSVTYVLLDESGFMPYREKYMAPWFDTVRDQFKLVFEEEGTQVWERIE